MIKSRTAALLIGITFAWWLIIFVDQLRRQPSCQPSDVLCNSGNTVWGDFTWSILMWILSMSLITPVIVAIVVVILKMQETKNKKSK